MMVKGRRRFRMVEFVLTKRMHKTKMIIGWIFILLLEASHIAGRIFNRLLQNTRVMNPSLVR